MQIALVGVLAALIAAAIAAYAWDRAQANDIADGIRVGGVPIGGLTQKQASHKLRSELVQPLEQPITVKFERTKYVLGPRRLDVRADIPAMLDAAHDASRSGGLPTRLWRYATGGDVYENLPAHVSYSRPGRQRASSTRSPSRSTRPPPTPPCSPRRRAQPRVRQGRHRPRPGAAPLDAHRRDRLRRAPPRRPGSGPRTKSAVTTDELAAKYPIYLTVDRANFQLRLWKNLKLAKTYTIAVGMQGLETPAGTYTINDKQVNPSWHVPDSAWAGDLAGQVIPPGPEDPIKARWMGFFDGAGIHGTDEISSIGSAASHGCIRMLIPDVIELYDQVPLGTPIYVG